MEKELGIPPVMSAADLANSGQIDKLSMVLYLTQVQKAFTVPAKGNKSETDEPKKHFTVNVFINYLYLFSDVFLKIAISNSSVNLT